MAGILRVPGPGYGFLYEDTEKTAGGADAPLVQQSHWKKDFKGQESGNG